MSVTRKSYITVVHLIAFVFGALQPTKAYAQPKRDDMDAAGSTRSRAAQDIVAMTNRERIKRKLHPLKIDRYCVLAITGHVNEMAMGRYLSHEGRDGRGASERYRRYKPAGRGAGENIAYNTNGTGASFIRQWLRSPGHRDNILSPLYRGIGVAVAANCARRGISGRCYYYAGQCFSP